MHLLSGTPVWCIISPARTGGPIDALPPDLETTTKRKTMKHMGQDERRRIEFMLGCGGQGGGHYKGAREAGIDHLP